MAATMAASAISASPADHQRLRRPSFTRQGSSFGSAGSDEEILDTIELSDHPALPLPATTSTSPPSHPSPTDASLLREWSYPNAATSVAPRTKSGTPIAVAVHDGDLLGIQENNANGEPSQQQQTSLQPPPPPPPGSACPLQSPILGAILSLPALQRCQSLSPSHQQQQPPPIARAVQNSLDRAIDQHGPVVAKLLTNSMCHLRCSIDHIYAGIAETVPVDDDAGGANDPAGDGAEHRDEDENPAEEDNHENDEDDDDDDDNWVLIDDDYHYISDGSGGKSEYDDQEDMFEEELMRQHGRGCLSRGGSINERNSGTGGNGSGPFRRVRKWVRRRRERCAVEHHNKKERKMSRELSKNDLVEMMKDDIADDINSSKNDVADDLATVASSLFAAEDGSQPFDHLANKPTNKASYDSSSSDGGCGFKRSHKIRGKSKSTSKKKSKKRRGWGRSRNNTEDSEAYSSSSGGEDNGGTQQCKKRKKRKKTKKNGKRQKKRNKDKARAAPAAPVANFIFRGAPAPKTDAEPPAQVQTAQVARFVGEYYHHPPRDGRYHHPQDFARPTTSINRSRTYSSPAALYDVAVAEKIGRSNNEQALQLVRRDPDVTKDRLETTQNDAHLRDDAVVVPDSAVRCLQRRDEVVPDALAPSMDLEPPKRPSDDELMRSITSAIEEDPEAEFSEGEDCVVAEVDADHHANPDADSNIRDDWVVVPSTTSVDPSIGTSDTSKSIKVVFLSSPGLGAEKSALVDSLEGTNRSTPRSSTGLVIRSLSIAQDLKMSLWDIPAGQAQASLAYSSDAIYVVVYDMGVSNLKTHIRKCSDAYDNEKASKEAKRALEQDIDDNVISFISSIENSAVKGGVILPLVLSDATSHREEEQRRLSVMEQHLAERIGSTSSIRLARRLMVDDISDLEPLKKEIIRSSLFFASPSSATNLIDAQYQQVHQAIMREKACGRKIISINRIHESVPSASISQIQSVLEALTSTGDVLYFGHRQEQGLIGQYVITDIKFFFSVVACVVRRDLEQDRHMRTRSEFSQSPIISAESAELVWQSMTFIRNALSGASTSPSIQIFYEFVEQVLVRRGIFIPLEMNGSTYFLVPSLLTEMPEEAFTYKTPESWRTILCHSWRFDSSMGNSMMDLAMISLLSDLYNSSEYVAHFKVYQVMVWRSALFLRIGPTNGSGSIDVLLHLVDDNSSALSVASASTESSMRRIVVSARGQAGGGGRSIWNCGLRSIIKSVDSFFCKHPQQVQHEIVCPECLANYHPSAAGTWCNDMINGSESQEFILCVNGHHVETALLCGHQPTPSHLSRRGSRMHDEQRSLHKSASSVNSLLGGVVVVGLYDEKQNRIHRIGSGFIADKDRGLVVTASHVLFDMTSSDGFGRPFYGFANAKAVIGVLPDKDSPAVFRYFAEILVEDICNVDACVLRITTRFDQDLHSIEDCAMQPEQPVTGNPRAFKELQQLKLTKHCELEESIRILGYNQGGEGVLPIGQHINRYPCFAKGYVCKKFKVQEQQARHHQTVERQFAPSQEIVAICPTIDGHSGGPVVNSSGSVVGILSRADPADSQRCYLVPSSELRRLLKKAKKLSQLTPMELYYRMNADSNN